MVTRARTPKESTIILDFSELKFIEPTGVTLLSNFIEWLRAHGGRYSFSGHDSYSQPIKYLDDSGFFNRYLGSHIDTSATLRSTTKPLEFISTAHSLSWLRTNLLTWITTNTNMNVATFRELLVCLQEIFQNIRDHSGTNIGSVFAQYFPNDGKLSISVSDIGSGIPEKVRNFLGADPISYADSTALVKACQENFTTSSHPGNAGKGLADLTLIITRHYNGKVIIISDYGYVQYLGRKGKLWVSDRNWLYPGCLIDIEININDIQEAVESVNEYEW